MAIKARSVNATMLQPLAERFWARVQVGPPSVCWPWTAGRHGRGYGHFRVGGTMERASRVAWALHHGTIPAGALVLHHCDRPECVNPKHLYLGTALDNAQDRDGRNRGNTRNLLRGGYSRPGPAPWRAKLTAAQVQTIRQQKAAGASYRTLARQFGVRVGTIWHIVTGRTWRHL
jgi:hypothetical protein